MKSYYLKYIALIFSVFALLNLSISGQIISTRAGTVKKVVGDVFYRCHQDEKNLLDLDIDSSLHNEDTLLTSESGSVVLALNSDSYLYVDEDAYVKIKNTELDKMHFDIERGEIYLFVRSLDNGASLVIHTPPGKLTIKKGGRYRIIVGENGNTEANVFEGELRYFDENGKLNKLKKGRQVNFVKKQNLTTKKEVE